MTVLSPAELAFNMTAELYRYGAAREVAGEHEEGDRITSANRTRAEAERIGARILDHYNHLLAAYNALEEQGSKLTREMDLKVDEIERQAEELTVLERNLRRAQKVADDRGEEIQQLRAKLAALEAKPTSAPPHLDPRKHDRGPGWGHTQMLDGQHLNDPLPSLGSVRAACTPEGCPTVAGRTPYAEAGETE